MAHSFGHEWVYVGDLSQFCHVMGAQSHWDAEDQGVHAAYENVVDRLIEFHTRTSSLLEPFLRLPLTVDKNLGIFLSTV